MKPLNFLTILFGKAMVKALKLIGRDAGNAPGLVLWTLNKNYLKVFNCDCPIIAVTGTNGKTSTTNFLNNIFRSLKGKDGKPAKVITNMQGNNLDTGIGSMLLQYCDMKGHIDADYLVLEVDESHVPVIFKHLKLETLVILNFFRDQLDRNGEVETLILKVQKFLKTYNGNLVLNADDPNVARLGYANPKNKNVYYYNVEKYEGATSELYEAGEGRFCPKCGETLVYDYYQYSHIGRFHCPKCGYGNIKPSVTMTDLDFAGSSFTLEGERYSTKHMGIYHLYNLSAVYTAAKLYDIDHKIIHNVFEKFEVNNGRLEKFEVGGCSMLLNLAKNPVGANMTLRLLNQDKGEKELLFVLNDNIADGTDVSWIWDINFSIFNGVRKVVTSGTRAYDIAIRIKCSGYDPERIVVLPDLDKAAAEIFSTSGTKYGIANYTAIQPTRAALKRYISANSGKNAPESTLTAPAGNTLSDKPARTTLKLLHMYPNVLDLYGDSGNVEVLRYRCKMRGIDLEVYQHVMEKADDIDFSDMDIIYLGGGADYEQQLLADDLMNCKDRIFKAYENKVYLLMICGGYQLLGQYYKDSNGKKIPGLGLFSYHTEASTNKRNRCIGNIIIEAGLAGKKTKVIGFENHGGQTTGVKTPFGKVLCGNGNCWSSETEGYFEERVTATYLHGPLLSKNPDLADYIISKALERKGEDPSLAPINDALESACRKELFRRLLAEHK